MTYKQVFIINSDLNMSKGKIGAMVGHGEVYFMEKIYNTIFDKFSNYSKWRYEENELMKKVVLKATEREITELMLKLKENKIWFHKVIDMGLTQVPMGSMTCIVVEPLLEEVCAKLFKHLRLL